MNFDLIIFGFNEFSLLLAYEMIKYDVKFVIADKYIGYSKNYLDKDSIIVYNGVSSFNYEKLKDNSCYEFVKKICNEFNLKNELNDIEFITKDKNFILRDSIILNLANIKDVLYNFLIKNFVNFVFDEGFKDVVKIKNEFCVNGKEKDLRGKICIDTRNFGNYKYVLTTYNVNLEFNKYFDKFIYLKKDGYDILFYKNFIGNIKVDIIHDINLNINHMEAIKEFISDIDFNFIIIKQVEYLKFSLFDKFNFNELALNKNYLGFNGIFYSVQEICKELKNQLSLRKRDSYKDYKECSLERSIDRKFFNDIVCYCNLLSKGDIMKILEKSSINTLEQLLCRIECRFNNCVDCYDKMCNILVEYTGRSIYQILDENVLRIKNFNEI